MNVAGSGVWVSAMRVSGMQVSSWQLEFIKSVRFSTLKIDG